MRLLPCYKMKRTSVQFIEKKGGQSLQPPPPCPNTERVNSAWVLGITIDDRLSAMDHVNNVLTSCTSLLYAMKVLRSHGIPLHNVFHATILAKITHCLPPWSGLCMLRIKLCESRLFSGPLQAPWFLWHQCRRIATISDISSNADDSVILKNSYHVLCPYCPDYQHQSYCLRRRPHNKALIPKTT